MSICSVCGKNHDGTSELCNECSSKMPTLFFGGPLTAGMVLENRYKIITLLKSGGMGSVYKALDNKLEREWAIKELLPNYGSQEEQTQSVEWFNREAKLLSRLDHSNLPIVSDYFINNGKYYLVMTFIEGEDLETILEREGKPGLPEDNVIDWAKQILQVLSYLHNQNPPIIYRDIKPSNIMLHKDGRAMLIDFGIARAINENSKTKKTAIGTMGYSPLEQCHGNVETRSDIYALGASMHHLLTGILPMPFKFDPLSELVPSISPEIEAIVMKSLQQEPSERFSTAKEMMEALNEVKKTDQVIKISVSNITTKTPLKTGEIKEGPKSSLLDPLMVLIPGGNFQMGNNKYDQEKPVHEVQVSSFYIHKYEVTNKEYCDFLNSQGNKNEGGSSWIAINTSPYCGITKGFWKFKVKPGYENRPVVNITWYGAIAYCNWLSQQRGYIPGYGQKDNRGNDPSLWRKKNGYRLPTEAEWEYACRSGNTTSYYWGYDMDGDYCWYNANSEGNLHDVGQKKPNSSGLFDMIGNVWEWCNDWYDNYPSDLAVNPTGPSSGSNKVIRGSGWDSNETECRSNNRGKSLPSIGTVFIGFRLVRTR